MKIIISYSPRHTPCVSWSTSYFQSNSVVCLKPCFQVVIYLFTYFSFFHQSFASCQSFFLPLLASPCLLSSFLYLVYASFSRHSHLSFLSISHTNPPKTLWVCSLGLKERGFNTLPEHACVCVFVCVCVHPHEQLCECLPAHPFACVKYGDIGLNV